MNGSASPTPDSKSSARRGPDSTDPTSAAPHSALRTPHSALILIGHGSTKNANSAAPTYQHAAELRRRNLFREVREAFWKEEPAIRDVLANVHAPQIFAVPVFLSDGYFTQEVIPAELGIAPANDGTGPSTTEIRPGQQLIYCPGLGMHPSITSVIMARAQEVVRKHPFPRAPKPEETSLFLVAHGTERNENSRQTVEMHASAIRGSGPYAEVQVVYLEESPRVGDCHAMATAKHIVMVPFFISDGLHAQEDVPLLLGEPERIVRERLKNGQPTWRNPTERRGKLLWYARSVGTEAGLADVILQRVEEAQSFCRCG